MKFSSRTGLVLALLCATIPIRAAQVIVLLRQGGNKWQITEGEKITFNQKDKLRAGSGRAAEFRPDEYKKFPQLDILRAGLLRRHAGGYLVRRTDTGWEPVVPDGEQVKTASSFAALWSSAPVALQVEAKAKTGTPLQPAEIYAIIPGADRNEAVANLISDPANFRGLGEANEDAAWEERMALLISVAPSITGAGDAKLKHILLSEMVGADQRLTGGIAKAADLTLGLRYVGVSAKAYSKDPQQQKARQTLIDRKAWLDQRMAILKAFRAGAQWDAFLNKYADFERWDNSFEDLHKSRDDAFQKSGQQHLAQGQRYYGEKNYTVALRELEMAQRGLPSNREIAGMIEKVKLDAEHEAAAARRVKPEDTTSTNYRLITRHLQNADNYINDAKLTEAEGEIQQSEGVDKTSPRILLSRAKLLQARKQLPQALEILDDYAHQVVDDGGKGDELRNKIAYELKTTMEKLKKTLNDAEEAGDYFAALKSAQDGLTLDKKDLDFLLHAGINNAILRKRTEAGLELTEYLRLSQLPGADQKRRADVYNAQSMLKATFPEPEGTPNWFSGYRNPPGLVYCPISLMPNLHPAEVKAKKLTSAYQWSGDQLTAVRTTSPDPADKDSQITVYFDYFKDRAGVRRIGTEPLDSPKNEPPAPKFTVNGTVGAGNGVYLGLPNHPVVDPLIAERLTGKRVATIVSGNAYFHPFAWTGIYIFIAEYDDQGRVKSARQIPAPGQQPRTLDFKWDGWKLMEVAERGGGYKRTMSYNGNKLMAETIAFGGKPGKIEYKYKGDQLLEAACTDDASIDNRPRHVTFQLR